MDRELLQVELEVKMKNLLKVAYEDCCQSISRAKWSRWKYWLQMMRIVLEYKSKGLEKEEVLGVFFDCIEIYDDVKETMFEHFIGDFNGELAGDGWELFTDIWETSITYEEYKNFSSNWD